jgi:hypothetical protein
LWHPSPFQPCRYAAFFPAAFTFAQRARWWLQSSSERPLRVNGTEVPGYITLRPYHDSPLRLNLYPLAAGWLRER